MRRPIVMIALILSVALTGFAPGARAALSEGCAKLRQSIVDMEQKIPSGAAFTVDVELRHLYTENCLKHPGKLDTDPWFDAQGKPTSGPPPTGDGVFQTTPEIADYCRKTFNPQLCADLVNLGQALIKDPDGDWVPAGGDTDPADQLPGVTVTIGGQQHELPDHCMARLAAVLFPKGLRDQLRASLSPPEGCEDIDKIKPQAAQFRQNIQAWSAAPQQNPFRATDPAAAQLQPDIVTMCNEAWGFDDICKQRQANMVTAGAKQGDLRSALSNALSNDQNDPGSPNYDPNYEHIPNPPGTIGQAGAFADCAALYDSVVQMCKGMGWQQPPDTPAATVAIPDQCQANATAYANAAQAQNTQAAIEAYQALSSQPACANFLSQVAAASGLPLPQRPMGSLTKSLFASCMNDPASCGPGASPGYASGGDGGGGGFDIGDLMNFGMALGGMAGQMNALRSLSAIRNTTTNMNSLAMPPVRATYGQGAPLTRPPTPNQSTITGLGN